MMGDIDLIYCASLVSWPFWLKLYFQNVEVHTYATVAA